MLFFCFKADFFLLSYVKDSWSALEKNQDSDHQRTTINFSFHDVIEQEEATFLLSTFFWCQYLRICTSSTSNCHRPEVTSTQSSSCVNLKLEFSCIWFANDCFLKTTIKIIFMMGFLLKLLKILRNKSTFINFIAY